MNKYFYFIVVVLLNYTATNAQHSLDEFRVHSNQNVRLLDINDNGMLCGYYNNPNNSNERGFIVTGRGMFKDLPIISGFNHTRVISINDRDTPTIIIKASNAVGLSEPAMLYKAYYFPVGDSISLPTSITLTPNNPNPTKVNNKNYMVGWYTTGQGSVNQPRYLWVHFDSASVMPSNHSNQYYATRYVKPPTNYQPTSSGGVNDNGIVCGYYYDLDNTNYISYVFDLNSNTFTPFTSSINRQLLDINNAGLVVGKIVNGSQERPFMGTYSGSMLTSIPVSIFETGLSIQSEFTGINNNGEIVGNYLHPTSGKWVGFIYRRNASEFRLPGFDFDKHTWKFENYYDYDDNPSNDKIWTNKYYKNNDYDNYDPVSNQAINVLNNTKFEGKSLIKSFTYSWLGFGKEADLDDMGEKANQSPQDSINYQTIFKPLTVLNCTEQSQARTHTSLVRVGFLGYCYGFTYTVLQRLYDYNTYLNWFGPQINALAGDSDNSDTISIFAIERSQMKQSDKRIIDKYNVYNHGKLSVWGGMHRLKTEMQKSINQTNPNGISIEFYSGWHSVMPYKIKTPQALPLDYPTQKHDTLFIYDSNIPGDSTQYILIQNNLSVISDVYNSIQGGGSSPIATINFNTPGVKDLPSAFGHGQNSKFKPNAINDEDALFAINIYGANKYSIKDNNGDSATLQNNIWTNNISDISPKVPYNTTPIAYSYICDTTKELNFITQDYDSLTMNWSSSNDNHNIGIYRETNNPIEMDYGVAKHKYWAYKNPDNTTKNLTLHYIQKDNNYDYGVNYLIKNFNAAPDDSLITSSPNEYQYKIVRINGDSISYDIKLYILDNGSLRIFDTTMNISGNSTQIYEPYYDGPQGKQLVVYVDNGNTGTFNDTLFLDPSDKINQYENVDYVSIYPNPANDILNIKIGKHHNAAYDISISDLSGKNIMKGSVNLKNGKSQLSLSNLSTGLYIVQLNKDGKLIYRDKVLKR